VALGTACKRWGALERDFINGSPAILNLFNGPKIAAKRIRHSAATTSAARHAVASTGD
jgi:hypothetical protein